LIPDFGGFGHIQIIQGIAAGMGTIGFSLAVPANVDPDGRGTPVGPGLIFNSLSGSILTEEVDLNEGIRNNIHPVEDPTQWQEFWITIKKDTSFFSTHKVKVYHNGSTQPAVYFVTAGNCDCDAPGAAGLALSGGYTSSSSAIDIDFVRVIEGVVQPETRTPVPLEMLGVERSADTESIKLVWGSEPNQSYRVETSFDLFEWLEIDETIPARELRLSSRSQRRRCRRSFIE
jgi:hypothetical protein